MRLFPVEIRMCLFVSTAQDGLAVVQQALKVASDIGAETIQREKGWMIMFREPSNYTRWLIEMSEVLE